MVNLVNLAMRRFCLLPSVGGFFGDLMVAMTLLATPAIAQGNMILETPSYPVPGRTSANLQLQQDVVKYLLLELEVLDVGCTRHVLIDTRVSKVNRRSKVISEVWTVNCCGKVRQYKFDFVPSPGGGTFIEWVLDPRRYR